MFHVVEMNLHRFVDVKSALAADTAAAVFEQCTPHDVYYEVREKTQRLDTMLTRR